MAKSVGETRRAGCRSARGSGVEKRKEQRPGTGSLAGELILPEGVALRKAPRPSGCSRFVRREIADAMPAICAMLLTRVMDGDLAALKLLLQMAVESRVTDGVASKRGGGSGGFARKVLDGFKTWEARETAKRT